MLLRRGLRDVCPRSDLARISFVPGGHPPSSHHVAWLVHLWCLVFCVGLLHPLAITLLYPLAILWSILSPLVLAYLTLGESQFMGCFLCLPTVGVFLATVIFPFGWTGKEGAHRARCNLTAILPLSGHRSSANPCCGLSTQLFWWCKHHIPQLFSDCYQCVCGSQNVLGFFFCDFAL